MRPEYCSGFKITPQTVFFPFAPFNEAFDTQPEVVKHALNKLTSETIAIHLWSSETRKKSISKSDSPNAYTILAEDYCPRAFEASGLYFN